jgi:hypothetical protein
MKNNVQGLRNIVAKAIEANPDAYTDIVLGYGSTLSSFLPNMQPCIILQEGDASIHANIMWNSRECHNSRFDTFFILPYDRRRPRKDYCDWIRKENSWGGAIGKKVFMQAPQYFLETLNKKKL